MSNKNTGGPAFPVEASAHEGMTLRDYFAAHAMSGLLSANWCATVRNSADDIGSQMVAIDAYMMAEAMLKARRYE